MDFKYTIFERIGELAVLEFKEAVDEVERDESLRALIITGEGKAFVTGADILWVRLITYTRHFAKPNFKKYPNYVAIMDDGTNVIACDADIKDSKVNLLACEAYNGFGKGEEPHYKLIPGE